MKDKRDILATPAGFCEAYMGFPKLYPCQIETLNPFLDATGNIIPSSNYGGSNSAAAVSLDKM